MSFDDFYHKYFGGRKGDDYRFGDNTEGKDNHNDARDSHWNFGGNDLSDPIIDFKIMTDPFEMHNFFEKKMNDIMKSFFTHDLFPSLGDVPSTEESINLRDLYLKPEFAQIQPQNKNMQEKDGNKTEESARLGQLLPFANHPEAPTQPRVFSSFKSVIKKTVILPDGTVTTEEIVRNSDGTEQKTESSNHRGVFYNVEVPKINIISDFEFLKPGFENSSPSGEKIDKDLDQETVSSIIEKMPFLNDKGEKDPSKSKQIYFGQSFSRQVVTLPNGVVETEEIFRNSDGTEQRTVTQTAPDQSPVKSGSNNDKNSNTGLSFALKGVKDLLDIIFK